MKRVGTPARPVLAPGPAARSARLALAANAGLAANAALVVVTLAAAAGMGRLFAGPRFLVPVVIAVLVGHGLAWGARRLGLGAALSLAIGALGLTLVVVWVLLPNSTVGGIPWAGSVHALGSALSQASAGFAQLTAPVPATKGFLVVAMYAAGVAGVLADWSAFRTGGTFEAVIPSFAIVVVTAVLGRSGGRILAIVAYVAALLLFLAAYETARTRATTAWFTSQSRSGSAAAARVGLLLGGIAVVAAGVIGPHLPGAGATPLVNFHHQDQAQPSPRITVNPLVDIRDRLVRQSNVEVFTVASDRPVYWRLTSLDNFDGNVWSSNDAYQPVAGSSLPATPTSAPSAPLVQDFHLSNLASAWLPAAYQPVELRGAKATSYNPTSGSIIAAAPTSDDMSYQVSSSVPQLAPAELVSNGAANPSFDAGHFSALPADLPSVIVSLARAAVAGQTTAYGKALALQRFFRSGHFRYSTEVPPGHSDNALVSFLTETKNGYCEQFAAAYAVMARVVGLPSRVAVGFTPGIREADGLYHVLGLDAHAWPEVHIGRAGWVAFEPTPGRGEPGNQAYTGVPAAQAGTTGVLTPPTSVGVPGSSNGATAPPPPQAHSAVHHPPNPPTPSHPSHLAHTLAMALGLLLLATLAIGAIPAAKAARRWHLRRSVVSAAQRVLVAWNEAAEALALAGAARRASETFEEHAARASVVAGLGNEPSRSLGLLASQAGAASYARHGVPEAAVQPCVQAAADVEHALRERASLALRIRWALSARPLMARPLAGTSGHSSRLKRSRSRSPV